MAPENTQMRLTILVKLGGMYASAELFCLLTFPTLADGNGDRKRVQGGRRKKPALLCAGQVIESPSANRMSAAEVIHEPLAGWINPRRDCCYSSHEERPFCFFKS